MSFVFLRDWTELNLSSYGSRNMFLALEAVCMIPLLLFFLFCLDCHYWDHLPRGFSFLYISSVKRNLSSIPCMKTRYELRWRKCFHLWRNKKSKNITRWLKKYLKTIRWYVLCLCFLFFWHLMLQSFSHSSGGIIENGKIIPFQFLFLFLFLQSRVFIGDDNNWRNVTFCD